MGLVPISEIGNPELHAARRACVYADFSGDRDGRFLRELGEPSPHLGRDRALHYNGLERAGPIAHDDEGNFPGGAQVGHPAAHGSGVACVGMQIDDARSRNGHGAHGERLAGRAGKL